MVQNNNVFAGFGEIESEETLQIEYGVNVPQIQAEVLARVEAGVTVAELTEMFREQLGLPENVVVFIDGAQVSRDAAVPTTARVYFEKPAGEKGSDRIELADEDAVTIVIAREDAIQYILRRAVEEGKVSLSLEDRVPTMGMEILSRGRQYLTIGHYVTEVKATRTTLRPIATMVRRLQGGIAEAGDLTVNTVVAGQSETPLRIELNGQPFEGCRELLAGETLVVVLSGETSQEDFNTWATEQHQFADGTVVAAIADRESAIEKRTAELLAMNWAELRIAGSKAGVKLSGLGRTGDAVRADILLKEFPEVDEEKIRKDYLRENAPELLEIAEPVETVALSDEEEEDE